MTESGCEYALLVRRLSDEDGGGWEAIVPDLPGCMSDGVTAAEAVENAEDAIESWKEAAEDLGRPVPAPGSTIGQWRQRVPRTLHETLKQMAAAEGVSLNFLVSNLLSQAVGERLGSKFAAPEDHDRRVA